MQSLPLILLGATYLVWVSTRALQLLQSRVFHVLPFGSMSPTSLSDTCVGIVISGVYMMYFGEYWEPCGIMLLLSLARRALCFCVSLCRHCRVPLAFCAA